MDIFKKSVFFFVPNLIGYTRVILACAAFALFENYIWFYALYAASQLFDAVDGNVARYLDQTTRFGAVLDMVTDRSSTAALLIVLSSFYKEYIIVFAFFVALDISSHYAHLYISLVSGRQHKVTTPDQNPLLRLYYDNKYVLFTLCLGNEGTLLFLYTLHFTSGPIIEGFPIFGRDRGVVEYLFGISLPLLLLKQLMNIIQLVQAAKDIAKIDVVEVAARQASKKTHKSEKEKTPKKSKVKEESKEEEEENNDDYNDEKEHEKKKLSKSPKTTKSPRTPKSTTKSSKKSK